jgi:hypothetical protein
MVRTSRLAARLLANAGTNQLKKGLYFIENEYFRELGKYLNYNLHKGKTNSRNLTILI